ncbi:MAG TPA: hypothetical protein PKI81_02940, partial [bacterium]|nr:hypothetical protein [bacterium]
MTAALLPVCREALIFPADTAIEKYQQRQKQVVAEVKEFKCRKMAQQGGFSGGAGHFPADSQISGQQQRECGQCGRRSGCLPENDQIGRASCRE